VTCGPAHRDGDQGLAGVVATAAAPSSSVGRERLQHATYVNQVVFIVETNYGPHHVHSSKFYDHYSLTKTLDAAFRLPCLNHACDAGVEVMSDLFRE
jgi:hypothetical protein